MVNKLKTLLNLYITFCKIGVMTFGGGLAMMPMMQKELIEKRHWITDDDLIDYYAIGQSTPGIVAVNVSTFIGYRQAGILGGIIGTLGIVTPSLIIIMILANLINSINDYPWVQRALKGVNIAVAALLTKVTFVFSKKTMTNIFSVIITLCSFFVVYFLKLPSFFVILGAILIGIIIHLINNKKTKRG